MALFGVGKTHKIIVIFTQKSQAFYAPNSLFSPVSASRKPHFARSSSSRHTMATYPPSIWHSCDRPFFNLDFRSRKPVMQYWWRTTRSKSKNKVFLKVFSMIFASTATVCTMSYWSRIRKWQNGACGGREDIVQFWWPCITYFDVFNTVNRCRRGGFSRFPVVFRDSPGFHLTWAPYHRCSTQVTQKRPPTPPLTPQRPSRDSCISSLSNKPSFVGLSGVTTVVFTESDNAMLPMCWFL